MSIDKVELPVKRYDFKDVSLRSGSLLHTSKCEKGCCGEGGPEDEG